jgi:hypothetical protein
MMLVCSQEEKRRAMVETFVHRDRLRLQQLGQQRRARDTESEPDSDSASFLVSGLFMTH